jgi:hypothetical protein
MESSELVGYAVQTSRECLKSAAVSASQTRDVCSRMLRVRNHLVAQDEGQQSPRAPSSPRVAQVLTGDCPQQAGEDGTNRDRVVRTAHLPSARKIAAVTERGQQNRGVACGLQLGPQVLGLAQMLDADGARTDRSLNDCNHMLGEWVSLFPGGNQKLEWGVPSPPSGGQPVISGSDRREIQTEGPRQ